ncbi:Glutamate--tRNA ligase,glutamyl-tRNA synthetase,Glutamyl- and glutaminyl-tRNA synthetases,glutamate--tRNA ligase,tRNA synthetases class I (E and Q), catalytic domain [Chlamydia serpentis]|uniref:Glutamate--tRNA ligase n=1 Tax=Chlamydia serpentis TaxID=1967782 RepID=A0A2R8FB75_9CHLA|nr:glutamate--tRNA ligase [Chlamydia serpentis]SPN73679.1 Glutamate--tRNA ligase,glutamyl-tRNA synthetase,Glutamyl- and glutaminyl-tRNA synthetases,glutamate--tRNA ligase,tRNA synthetases class I (E and Q), catalytic domain [Chlamydia serpentis]
MNWENVRVRVAPSPTGDPHVGTAYMALFNEIFAKRFKGKMVLRIEDTDRTRSREDYEQNIFAALHWCGIQWDEGPDVGGPYGPYRQSERTEIYQGYVDALLKTEYAYKCFATPEELAEMRAVANTLGYRGGYDRRYRYLSPEEVSLRETSGQPYTVRLKVPLSGECIFEDYSKGRVVFPWADVDDQVLVKSDGFPTYHFANVIDDHLMGITHVLRGEEWLSSTPKHLLLYQAFGWEPPVFLHMPLLLNPDGTKLSKRKNPTSIFYYRDTGYVKEAFVNFLTLMGYSMESDEEIYPLERIITNFNPRRIGKSGAVFDIQKLDWINKYYLNHKASPKALLEELKGWLLNDEFLLKILPLCQSRIANLAEFIKLTSFFFSAFLEYSVEELLPSALPAQQAALVLYSYVKYLEKSDQWTKDNSYSGSKWLAQAFNIDHKKTIIPLLYVALTGKRKGLPLFDSLEILGKPRARARLLHAQKLLGGVPKKLTIAIDRFMERDDFQESTFDLNLYN